jgi:intein/homing endonuclease
MRIWLQEGKQKELIEKERQKLNLTWKEFSEKLGISFGKLNSFHYEENLMDEALFYNLSLNKDYIQFIIKKLPEGWGKIKGGKLSPGKTKEINIPEKNEELAELWGIILGDGNIQRRQAHKIAVYNINITGHSILDKSYLLNFVRPLGERLFNVSARVYLSKFNKGLHIIFDSRKVVDFFEREGFRSGNKIKNQSTIPDWIKENPRFLAACLRGLHDTDGSFYRLTNQNSYQIGFTNHNRTLLKDAQKGLLSLGIGVSKIIGSRKYVITKKSEIAKFYKVIGFHNPKHLNKIKNVF